MALIAAVLTGISKTGSSHSTDSWTFPRTVRDHGDRTGRTDDVGALPRSRPRRIEVGGTNLSVPVVSMDRGGSGRTRRAPDRGVAGWDSAGPSPGEPGSATIVGPLETATSRSGGYRTIRTVRQGDRVRVIRRDHRVAWFEVDSVRHLPSGGLAHVRHEDDGRPELRLLGPTPAATPGDVLVSAHLVPPGDASDGGDH